MRLLELNSTFRDIILGENPVLVDIQSAARWFFEDSPQEHWDFHEDMSILTPPIENTYLEFTAPDFININGRLIKNINARLPFGCILSCTEIRYENRATALQDWLLEKALTIPIKDASKTLKMLSQDAGWLKEREQGIINGVCPRFVLFASIYSGDGSRLAHVLALGMYLDENGKAFPSGNGTMVIAKLSEDMTIDQAEFFKPFAFALSLMNCKNVELIEDQRRLTRQAWRRMERTHTPKITYKWLHIKQLRRRVDYDFDLQKAKHSTRLHFVRAHWATYTNDAPLFGKYEGTFFKPSHVRGDLSKGIALKDYKVDKP